MTRNTLYHFWRVLPVSLVAILTACSSPRPGGYFQDDGPPERVAASLDNTPDATPRIEPLSRGGNQPYVIKGKRYVPDLSGKPYRARGIASWYGTKFHGKKTSNGETYDMYAMTAAHPTLPLPSYVRVTRVATGRSVVLRVNDRGPFHNDRIIDLSYGAAYKLGIHMLGSDEVIVERIMPDEIPGGNALATASTPAAPAPASVSVRPVSTPAPVSVSVPAPKPAPAASGRVSLQMGAFRESGNAQALAARVTQSLNAAAPPVSVRQSPNDRLYRVRVGPYATRKAALDAAQTLSDRTGIKPILVKP